MKIRVTVTRVVEQTGYVDVVASDENCARELIDAHLREGTLDETDFTWTHAFPKMWTVDAEKCHK